MFKIFRNAGRYDRGQLFPYLIAILVAVLTIAMITVNLGQIGIFKTDVSNAADAGALAGASTLSGYLLGIGLQSEKMCGVGIIALVVIILAACTVFGILVAILAYIALLIKQYVTLFQALEDGKMAWSNAKKTALSYAFQNAGIDEPRPTFKQFMKNVYGVDSDNYSDIVDIAKKNRIYALGDDPGEPDSKRKLIKKHTQSGFSRFMELSEYWDEGAWGEIKPGKISPAILTSRYRWANVDGENEVKVTVMGNIMYPLKLYNPAKDLSDKIREWIKERLNLPWYLSWLIDIYVFMMVGMLGALLPMGLMMKNIQDQTDKNPITVKVERYKRDKNLGLWNFRYCTVQSQASAHAYGEKDPDGRIHDIKPLLFDDVFLWIARLFVNSNDSDFQIMDTSKHLFEVELMAVR